MQQARTHWGWKLTGRTRVAGGGPEEERANARGQIEFVLTYLSLYSGGQARISGVTPSFNLRCDMWTLGDWMYGQQNPAESANTNCCNFMSNMFRSLVSLFPHSTLKFLNESVLE